MRKEKCIFIILLIFASGMLISCQDDTRANIKEKNEERTNFIASPADKKIIEAKAKVNANPQSSETHLQLASAYLKKVRETGDYSINRTAEISIDKALEIEPDNFNALVLRSQIYLSEHKFAKALELSQKMEKMQPKSTIVYAIKTDALTELGKYDEAVESAQKLVDMRPDATSFSRVAHLRFLHGDTDGAIEARRKVIRISDPSDKEALAWAYSQLGKDYFETGKFDEAELIYNRALEIFPDYHWGLAGKGQVLAAKGNLKEAATIYEKLRSRVPEANREIFLGDIYTKMGRKEDAQKIYREVAEFEKNKSDGDMHRIALLWADHKVNLDEALNIARMDREEYDDLLASDTYAWTLYQKGDYGKAKEEMKNALRLNSKNALFFYHLGMIENKLNNKEAAIKNLKLALDTNPSFDLLQADTAKETLQRLRNNT